ncbi:MAG: CehA/McbA family metallohydrolase [Candidatus Hydrogenedentes bacterium]|nr:CehA/McbA family metallohydrolase [Candidatus Hydrogenedentota bacterium]
MTNHDGPASSLFTPIPLKGGQSIAKLQQHPALSKDTRDALQHAPSGECTSWGMPFDASSIFCSVDKPVALKFNPIKAPWLVFMHTTDLLPFETRKDGFPSPTRGIGRLAEEAASYTLHYADGSTASHTLRRRHEIHMRQRPWGENALECVGHRKPIPLRTLTDQPDIGRPWGNSQFRTTVDDLLPWMNWIWAWEHPQPRKALVGLTIEAQDAPVFLFAVTAGRCEGRPYCWGPRRKAIFKLPKGSSLDPRLDEDFCLRQIRIDLGQIASVEARCLYPNDGWAKTSNNAPPDLSDREVLVEYAAHPQAVFHLEGGKTIPAAKAENGNSDTLMLVAPATQRVTLRVVEKGSKRPVPVKLHVHGEAGEYLAPIDRHRYPNSHWFEDYSVDFVHRFTHNCTYIDGETTINLPLGKVYIEISKGYEIRPIRKVLEIGPRKRSITIELEKVLPWRERGWITADTHVHFISPTVGLLEGAAEGVNVVNLLASQWGELFTNVGDFDGRNTWGAPETGGEGEYLLRVGTENRQHLMGHISLLGYGGRMITPLCTGGPDESGLGDGLEVLMSEWARQCKAQNGLVVMPHFPQPRLENASTIVHGDIDAVEMCSWENLYSGIDPYSLVDWYRYLNCGYFVPAVGGTDKMTASTPIGAVRTYARLAKDTPFTYDTWMQAVRSGHTFVSYGPLLEFQADGVFPGGRIAMTRSGGTVHAHYEVASVVMPMTRVDLIVNGEVRESRAVKPGGDSGDWKVKIDRSSWLALLVRGQYPGHPEMIAAHSSAVAVEVAESPFYAAADAATILEQIEGAMAYLDTLAACHDPAAYKRMRLVLTSAHRKLHNRMHAEGHYHEHTHPHDHHH